MNNTKKIDELANDSDELKLELIEPTDKQIQILYELLKLREHSRYTQINYILDNNI